MQPPSPVQTTGDGETDGWEGMFAGQVWFLCDTPTPPWAQAPESPSVHSQGQERRSCGLPITW